MKPRKILSGGQNGADLAGLEAAKKLGIPTGGTAPKGWRVQDYDGNETSNPQLADFGLVESDSREYRDRTIKNVEDSDGTVWFGYTESPGGKLTISTAIRLRKPIIINPNHETLKEWVKSKNIAVLNIAGNRLSAFNPGIYNEVFNTIMLAFNDE